MSKESAEIVPSRERVALVRCLVVDDHMLVLQWFCALLQTLPDVRIVGVATSLAEAAAVLEQVEIDLLIVDAGLPDGNGEECVRMAWERCPRVQSIVLHDAADGSRSADLATDAMARVIHKQDPTPTFLRAVRDAVTAIGGQEPALLDAWLLAPEQVMSKREYEIFCGIGRGLANKQIAASLRLSPQTVETHRKSVARKIGASGSDLVRKATIHVMLAAPAFDNEPPPTSR